MTTTCPKCGHIRSATDDAPDWQCPRCGIAYAKYQAHLDRADAAMPAETGRPRAAGRLSINEIIVICVGIVAAMLLIRGMLRTVTIVHAALLVPFFMCLVPAISSMAGDGLYFWNRRQATFEAYDAASHPVLFRLQQVFYCLFAGIFAVFFFRL